MALREEFQKAESHFTRAHPPHPEDVPILSAEHLTMRYKTGSALEDASFELRTGERLAIVGPNGAGKSTLLKIIAGVLTPTSGSVRVFGHHPSGHICIAYIPQRSQADWDFPVSVEDVVMMGRIGQLGLFRNPKARDWELVHQALETVNLADFAKRQISQLSGGQQQRMFIARALAQQAELMLMDEPLTGLDVTSQDEVFRILDQLRKDGVTVMVSLHDLQMAAQRFDRVMLLHHRMFGIGEPDAVLTSDNLLAAYGGHLRLIPADDGMIALGDTCCGEGL